MVARLDTWISGWRWPALALIVSVLMLASAHIFERVFYFLPCPLCLRQREVYWAAAAMALTGLILWRIRQNRRFLLALNLMLGLVFLTGVIVAGYHAGVEWRFWPAPTGCAVGSDVDVMGLSLDNLDARRATESCLDAPFRVLGLSMAGLNALASLVFALASFRAAAIALPRTAAD